MKYNYLIISLFVCLLFSVGKVNAQGGIVTTVIGRYSGIVTTADGSPALQADLKFTTGIFLDASRNIYEADSGYSNVRRVLATTNRIYTYAGNGTPGFSGDGGMATLAQLNNPQGIFIDAGNNLYIADAGNGRIRKVDPTTGIITTVGGGGPATSEGLLATNSALTPRCVYVDAAGNIYTGGSNKVRKINATTGIITSIAGNSTNTNTGDGGPAMSAGIAGPVRCITTDAAGNMYIIPGTGDLVRKINASTGIITTVAGGGLCVLDGVPATISQLSDIHGCVVDAVGNIIIADRGHRLIRQVDGATGIIHTIDGGGTSTADNVPALTANNANYMLYMDNTGTNIYYSTYFTWVRKLSYSPTYFTGILRDSMRVSIDRQCSGPRVNIVTNYYFLGSSVRIWWGDGKDTIVSVGTGCGLYGFANITHNYLTTGAYTLKVVEYNGTSAIDSFHTTYHHTVCKDINLSIYYDANNNCNKDNSENYFGFPILYTVDSNGIVIDTISATSGFSYHANGNVGDIYHFRTLTHPSGLNIMCPSVGYISDTLKNTTYENQVHYAGLQMDTTTIPGFDLTIRAVVPVTGRHDQWGDIYVWNNNISSTNAHVDLKFSHKYFPTEGTYLDMRPTPVSYTDTTASWLVYGLSVRSTRPTDLYYAIWDNPSIGYLTANDTVHSYFTVSPSTGDTNPFNNNCMIIDTVNASSDPNEISVNPSGCLPRTTKQLEYTIHFENTGNDTAFNIHVMDTLSNDLDVQSMRIVMSSASMNVSVIKTGAYNVLKFDFPDINLLDSSHHGECSGAIIYTINLNSGVPAGTRVSNRAGIYFDYNSVVMTNTVTNNTGCPTSVDEISAAGEISIYPNPTTGILTIKAPKDDFTSLSIANSIGQLLITEHITNTQTTINVNNLAPGLYYLTLKGESGVEVRKFVKE